MSWPFFEHACVINLDARSDRWKKMQSQLTQFGIEEVRRFSAISFDQLENDPPPDQLRNYVKAGLHRKGEDINFEHQLNAMWACLLSHLGVIALAKQENWPSVLILEDDCAFEPYIKPVLQSVEQQLMKHKWDILFLGGDSKKKGLKVRISPNLFAVNRVRLCHAYVVRSNIYEKILCEAPLAGMTIDAYYSEILLPQVNAMLIDPKVAYQRPNEISDISQKPRRLKFNSRNIMNNIKRWFARLKYGH